MGELDDFYRAADPWGYESNPDDARRKRELLSILPAREWGRVLDVGCGGGFLTFSLPGALVLGTDVSERAVMWAERARSQRADAERFHFRVASIFDLPSLGEQPFDLVAITGVLYPQYIGAAKSVVRRMVDAVLSPGGVLVSCHIQEWQPPRFPYVCIDTAVYPYRDYIHRLEVYQK